MDGIPIFLDTFQPDAFELCVALVAEGSVEDSLLKAKLNPKRPKMMAPFVRKAGMTIFSVESPPNAPRIFAELQVWPRTWLSMKSANMLRDKMLASGSMCQLGSK